MKKSLIDSLDELHMYLRIQRLSHHIKNPKNKIKIPPSDYVGVADLIMNIMIEMPELLYDPRCKRLGLLLINCASQPEILEQLRTKYENESKKHRALIDILNEKITLITRNIHKTLR